MAGDWIKITKSLPDKPEVWAIAQALDLDPDAVTGKLFRVWAWFDEQTENGNAPRVTKLLLDRQVGVTGFCDELQAVGWLVDDGNSIAVPNFDRHNSKTAKNRALTNERVARLRQKSAQETDSQRNGNASSVTKSVTREEKRREENNISRINNPSYTLFDITRYALSDDDVQWLGTLELDMAPEAAVSGFRLYHKSAGTKADSAHWSTLFRGWITRTNLLPEKYDTENQDGQTS